METYCLRCKKKVEINENKLEFLKQNSRNKMNIYQTRCPICSNKVIKLLKEKR